MKKLLGIALLVAFVAAGINDIGRYFTTRYDLGEQTTEMAIVAAEYARKGESRTVVGSKIASMALQQGIVVTAYDQDVQQVAVYSKAPVNDTWVIARAAALLGGKPMDTPMYVVARKSRFLN